MEYVISYVDKMMWQLSQQPFQKNEKIIVTSQLAKGKRN